MQEQNKKRQKHPNKLPKMISAITRENDQNKQSQRNKLKKRNPTKEIEAKTAPRRDLNTKHNKITFSKGKHLNLQSRD